MLNPFIYLTILVYGGFLIGVFAIPTFVARVSKCRSKTAAIIFGTLSGVLAIYISWYTFLYVILRKDLIAMDLSAMLNPFKIYDTASFLSVKGYYSLFGNRVSGGFLWFIWIVEAIGIFIAGVLGGSGALHKQTFCEDCKNWAENLDFNLNLKIPDRNEAKNIVESNIMEILHFPKMDQVDGEHLRVNIQQCPDCKKTITADIDHITFEKNSKGELSEKSEDFTKILVLTPEEFELFVSKKNETLA